MLIQQVKIFHLPDPRLSEGGKSTDSNTEFTTKSLESIQLEVSEVVRLLQHEDNVHNNKSTQTIEEEKRKEEESPSPQTQVVRENLSLEEDIPERTSPATHIHKTTLLEDDDKESTTPTAQERGHEITSSPKTIAFEV